MSQKAMGWEVPQQRPNALRKRFQMQKRNSYLHCCYMLRETFGTANYSRHAVALIFVITYQLGISPLITTIWSLWWCEQQYLCFMRPSQEKHNCVCFEVEIELMCLQHMNADGIERWLHAQTALCLCLKSSWLGDSHLREHLQERAPYSWKEGQWSIQIRCRQHPTFFLGENSD